MLTKKIRIVKMSPEDLEGVKELEVECNLEFWSIKDYLFATRRRDSIALVAKADQQVIGFLVARLIINYLNNILPTVNLTKPEDNGPKVKSPETELEAEIYNIAVKENFRGRSIGKALLNDFLKLCRPSKTLKIWLEARESNRNAIQFYRKFGFETVGLRKNFYKNPPENAIVMVRTCDQMGGQPKT